MAELVCGACNRRFVFKPEYAGKTLKCKCGQAIKAPAAVPATAPGAARQAAPVVAKQAAPVKPVAPAKAAPAVAKPAVAAVAAAEAAPAASGGEDDFNDLFSSAEAEYEMAPTPLTTAKPPIARLAAAAAGEVGGGGGPTSPLLAYSRAVPKTPQKEDEDKAAAVSQLYIPIALIIVGLVAYMFSANKHGAHSAVEASIYVFVCCFLNLALVFGALLLGVQLIGLGLGPLGPALLKVAAVAILPAAVGDLIQWYAGSTYGIFAFGVTLVMYYILLYYLFDMDGGEIRIVTGIMWAVQFLLGMFILGALMSGMGLAVAASSGAGKSVVGSMMGSSDDADDVPDDAKMSPAELDKWCESQISGNTAFEAHEWLAPKNTHNQGLGWSQPEVRELTDKFVVDGAKKIWCSAIEKGEEGDMLCTRLIVELPTDPGKRQGCCGIRDFAEKREEDSKDTGGKYLTVMIHVIKPHRR